MSNELDSIKVLLLEAILNTYGTVPRSNIELQPILDRPMFLQHDPQDLRDAVHNWQRSQGADSDYNRIKVLLDESNADVARNNRMASFQQGATTMMVEPQFAASRPVAMPLDGFQMAYQAGMNQGMYQHQQDLRAVLYANYQREERDRVERQRDRVERQGDRAERMALLDRIPTGVPPINSNPTGAVPNDNNNHRPATVADLENLGNRIRDNIQQGTRDVIQSTARANRHPHHRTTPPAVPAGDSSSTPKVQINPTNLFPEGTVENHEKAIVITNFFRKLSQHKRECTAAIVLQSLARGYLTFHAVQLYRRTLDAVLFGVETSALRANVLGDAPWRFDFTSTMALMRDLIHEMGDDHSLYVFFGNEFASNYQGGIVISCPVLHLLVVPSSRPLEVLSMPGGGGMRRMQYWGMTWERHHGSVYVLCNQPNDASFVVAKWANLGKSRYETDHDNHLEVSVNFTDFLPSNFRQKVDPESIDPRLTHFDTHHDRATRVARQLVSQFPNLVSQEQVSRAIRNAVAAKRQELVAEMKEYEADANFFDKIWACKVYPSNIDELSPTKPGIPAWNILPVENRNNKADAHEFPVRRVV